MAYDWKNITQQQLGNNPTVGLQNGPGMQAVANMQQKPMLTGANPNPQFPRLRNAWEHTKRSGSKLIWGTPGQVEQAQNFGPEQQGIFHLLQQLGIYGLQNPYEGFEDIAQQAENQFNQQDIPSLAHRFTSLGSAGLDSPDFTATALGAQAGLRSDLAAQRAQYGQQNIQQILQMLQLGLQPQFENIYRPREAGVAEELGKAALGNISGISDYIQKKKALKALNPEK